MLAGGVPRAVNRGALGATVLLLTIGAQLGAPPAEASDAVAEEARGGAAVVLPNGDVDLHAVVRRVLDRRCVSCHSDGGPASKLSLETYASILRGGKGGPSLLPGRSADSTMVHRMRLPLSDPKHMPPSDETQMTAAELDAIILWIERGGRELDVVSRAALADRQLAMLQAAVDPPPGAAPVVADAGKGIAKKPGPAAPRPLPAATGCAGCAVGGGQGSPVAWLTAVAVVSAALLLRASRCCSGGVGR